MGIETRSKPAEQKGGQYVLLFCALVLMFILLPLIREGSASDLAMDLMFLAILVGSLRAVSRDRRVLVGMAVLGLGLLASPGWGLIEASALSVIVFHLSLIGFLALVITVLVLEVYRSSSVTFATILGACSIYLLIGTFWFGVFVLIEALQPGSFVFAETHKTDLERDADALEGEAAEAYLTKRPQLFYYTFVTLTTLGYGDVRPVSDVARVYATLAAIMGQLYIAILVARLVALHTTQPRAP